MEKISLSAATRSPAPIRAPAAAAATAQPAFAGRATAPLASRRTSFSDAWAGDIFWDMLSQGGFPGASAVSGDSTLFIADVGVPSDDQAASLGDYEAMMNARDADGGRDPASGAPQFVIPESARQPIIGAGSAGKEDALTRFEPEAVSVEQFSITHPVWGFLEVDSRREGAGWGVVVRCGDADTRQRLKSREGEFRALLRRDFGVELELDVQPAAQP